MRKPASAISQQTFQTLQLAQQHHVRGAVDQAIQLYRDVLKAAPNQPDALHLLGVAELQKGRFDKAEQLLSRAIKLQPNNPEIYSNLGALHRKQSRPERAIRCYREAIRLNPRLVEAHYNLGSLHYDQEEFALSVSSYEEALRLDPTNVEALVNLGGSYKALVQAGKVHWSKVPACYEKALSYKPDLVEAYANIGSVCQDRGWNYSAMLMFDKALRIAPHQIKYRFRRAMNALAICELGKGWDDYEFRFKSEERQYDRRPGPPYWEGEDLVGKEIFVWPEQGLGDQIIFSSMLPDLIARGGKVVVESKPRLANIFMRSFPDAQIISRDSDEGRVDPGDADYQICLTSLGKFFRRDLASFPRRPSFLKADPVKVAAAQERYRTLANGRKIVGVSWRSKNEIFGALKSTELLDWAQVLKVPGVFFVNLQYGDCRDDLAKVRDQLGVEIYQDPEVDPMGDLDDFFAQVSAMDLVLSTSSTTVHTSGSINVPTWLILPRGPFAIWYWFRGQEVSPWYPSLRTFWQLDKIDVNAPWDELMGRIAAALARRIAAGPEAPMTSPVQ